MGVARSDHFAIVAKGSCGTSSRDNIDRRSSEGRSI